jgi:hypothetical protein
MHLFCRNGGRKSSPRWWTGAKPHSAYKGPTSSSTQFGTGATETDGQPETQRGFAYLIRIQDPNLCYLPRVAFPVGSRELVVKVLVYVGVTVASAQLALSCDLCAIYAASRARGDLGSGPFAGVAEQYTHFGTLQLDGGEVSNPAGQYLDSSISQLFAGYNFNHRIGLQLNLPVVYRSYRRLDGLGGIDEGSVSGIGDLSLLGNFVAYQKLSEKRALTWSVLGGVKFPTGNTDRLREEFNEMEDPVGPPSGIHGHDLTLGSGSYDGIIGTSVYARWGRVFGTAQAQYSIRSTGAYDYRFANDLTWFGGPGYYFLLMDDYSLGLQAVVSGEYKPRDEFRGATAEDTGITAVYLGAYFTFTWHSNLSAQLGADFPVSIDNTSFQIVPDYRVRAAFTWHF